MNELGKVVRRLDRGRRKHVATLMIVAGVLFGLSVTQTVAAPTGGETPAELHPVTDNFDFVRRDVMIPMRDGVKLHTVILTPRTATADHRAGIVLTRTPYNANDLTGHAQSGHLLSVLNGYDNAADVIVDGGYIRVVQDVRGKYGSEGDYVMNRPLAGTSLNATTVDHATDTYDTIDWLVKNLPESNGKAAIIGISYDGFLPLMALVHPHPALKASVPMNPMVDGWMGDDWFHKGAFRAQNIPYIYEQDGTRDNKEKWWSSVYDDYDLYMRSGSAGALGKTHGVDQTGFWRKMIAHPNYDGFWQAQAMDKILADQPLKVPVLLVHSLWDAEDIYGAMAVYKAIKPKDVDGTMVHLAFGPWHHGQSIEQGQTMGAIDFGSDTSKWFRMNVLAPFLAHYLKDDAPPLDLAPVTAFESGTNRWLRLPAWPASDVGAPKATPLYLKPHGALGFAPSTGPTTSVSYISDPAHPVPFRARPIKPVGYGSPADWADWLVDDQREASGRPDVATFVSEPLTSPMKIAGEPIVNLLASTTGSDADWVVKLIDVYPDEVPMKPQLGGYQLAVSMDILRGRFREGFETPKPIKPGAPLNYRFALPTANHVFLPGHRVMVQVQSSWFPLYDRNPQSYVDNIFLAKPEDYHAATQSIVVSGQGQSFVSLPLVGAPD
jgi:putative CocE/NonD family hydrolase